MDEHIYNTRLISLLQKYIENKCNEEELHTLLSWLKSSDKLDDFNLVSETLWSKLDGKYKYPEDSRLPELNREVDILLQQIRTKPTRTNKINITRRNFFYRIASVFLLLIMLGGGYLLLRNAKVAEEVHYTEITVKRAEIKEYTLPDGTHITLNSGTTLRIPSDYNKENRQIEMLGEGFFDVTPNPQKPFIIKSGDTQVRVLGTSFNIKSYPEDASIGVTVTTGKVLVNFPSIDLQVRVTPLEHLQINKQTQDLSKLTLSENYYSKWKEGTLYFYREPLTEIIKTISRKYDRNVVLRCKNCNPIITGTHDNKSLDALIESICFTTGLKSRPEGNAIILYE